MVKEWNTSLVYWTGVAALIPQAYLTFMSFPSIRVKGTDSTNSSKRRTSSLHWDYFIATGAVYMFSLLAAQIKTYFVHGLHHATLTPLPAGLIQIKIPTKASWKPGQHVFLRIFGVGIHSFTAHPFTVSSLPEDSNQGKENEMVFYIKPRRGVTARLAKEAEELPGRVKAVMLEGPYGGLDTSLDRFDTILVITGGSGAGFSLAIIKEILRMNNVGEKKRKLQMIFSTRVPSAAEWYQNSLDTILSTSPGSNNMDISKSIHITSGSTRRSLEISDPTDLEKTEVPNTSTEITSDFSRPDIPSIVTGVISSSTTTPAKQQRIGIFTCGPTSMIHDTRAATARAQRDVLSGRVGEIYLHDECFSW
ncbi:Ferric-chelate reductase [Aspergillus sclerotialis]|uniref:ferric-chelate reductase (NADPH) n=1 Tax=Aspergillus sclerotialis TaxID=2070753 RepID=A0A3A2ZIB7_9EURO|nr:Ferric-chelate reductase [Aspergillus sclerotialis]